jgi:hypothetical protein
MMDYSVIQTWAFAIVWMLGLLSLILGLQKMIRIIMANYLISSILLWLSNFTDLVTRWLLNSQSERRVDGFQIWFAKLIAAWKPTFLLTVYFVLLLFIITKSHIGIGTIKNPMLRVILTVIFLPCTIISILLSVSLAIFGSQVMTLDWISVLADTFSSNVIIHNAIMLTPLWVVIPWLVTILVAAFVLRTHSDPSAQEIIIWVEDPEWGNDEEF